jgi:hypothetical protein
LLFGASDITVAGSQYLSKRSDVVSEVRWKRSRVVLNVVDATIRRELGNDNVNRVKRVAGHDAHGEKSWFHVVNHQTIKYLNTIARLEYSWMMRKYTPYYGDWAKEKPH